MRKIIPLLLFFALLSSGTFAENKIVNTSTTTTVNKAVSKAEAKKLTGRLHEIRNLARSANLSVTEKKQLRQEVKDIRDQLEKMDGVYLYLSATAILIIILLILLV